MEKSNEFIKYVYPSERNHHFLVPVTFPYYPVITVVIGIIVPIIIDWLIKEFDNLIGRGNRAKLVKELEKLKIKSFSELEIEIMTTKK